MRANELERNTDTALEQTMYNLKSESDIRISQRERGPGLVGVSVLSYAFQNFLPMHRVRFRRYSKYIKWV